MTGAQMLVTSGLLGAFVLLAFCYGLLYGLGRLRSRRDLLAGGFAAYGLQCIAVAGVLLFTPLLGWWKAFIVLSCAAYAVIPPVTWRYLASLHRLEDHRP